MTEPTVDIEDVLKAMRDQIGAQAQEIAVLRAQLSALKETLSKS